MPDSGCSLTVKVVSRIEAIEAADWDACAGADNPSVCHAFLAALEASGSVAPETGWQPQHLIVEDPAGRAIGAAAMYLKGHSYGEYVFDWGWADAYERAGGRYYPKLQVAVPFTPVTGPRLMVRPGTGADGAGALMAAMAQLARRHDISSVHVTYPPEAEWRRLGEAGWLQRTGEQFHWHNPGYDSFEDFLGALSARKRKAIRRERRAVAEQGIRLHALTGAALTAAHWDAFYGFYIATADKKWGYPYLSREFFERIGATMADRLVLVMAERDGRWIAGAFNILGRDAILGRNWGCHGDYPFLHFEACYYQAIEFAIAHGLARVEAGAQGPHKLQRGYLPVRTYSAHWIGDQHLRRAVERYLARERMLVDHEVAALATHSPYRTEDGGRA